MIIKDPNNYSFLEFQKDGKKHKYYAILENKKTKKILKVGFGGIKKDGMPYQQYKDRIGLYSNYDHLDPKRRQLYLQRHRGEALNKYSSGWFSINYLW